MENIIEMNHYNFAYQTGNAVIQDLSFNIKMGSITTLVGNTGGGKTTLVKLLTGLLCGDGSLKVFGKEVTQKDICYTKEIGIVLGNPYDNFTSKTVLEDLIFPLENLRLQREEIEKYLDDIISMFKIESLLNKNPKELNSEEAVIVALASALITKPSLLILDDAFSKIGSLSKKKIMRILKNLNSKYHITILNVTHDINEVLDGTDALLLYNGKIVLSDSVEEFIKHEKELKRYHYELPYVVDLSNKLQYYNVIDHPILDMKKMVNIIWK